MAITWHNVAPQRLNTIWLPIPGSGSGASVATLRIGQVKDRTGANFDFAAYNVRIHIYEEEGETRPLVVYDCGSVGESDGWFELEPEYGSLLLPLADLGPKTYRYDLLVMVPGGGTYQNFGSGIIQASCTLPG